MATVTYDHVTKRFGDFVAVNDLNLAVRDSEFLVLVGPSGCGKTTALRMLAGLEEQTTGDIRIGERVVNDVAPKDRDIAMVFQNYALYPHMTVYDNMAFGLRLRKYARPEIDRRVKETAELLGIQMLLERKPKQLSGGQRQRVALAMVILKNAPILVLDEATSALDSEVEAAIQEQLDTLMEGRTVIAIAHRLSTIARMDRLIVLNEGRIVEAGSHAELLHRDGVYARLWRRQSGGFDAIGIRGDVIAK